MGYTRDALALRRDPAVNDSAAARPHDRCWTEVPGDKQSRRVRSLSLHSGAQK